MDHTVMVVLVLLWSSGGTNGVSSTGLQAEETNEPNDPVRFVGGSSRCAGALAVKHGEWKLVGDSFPAWTLKEAAAVCRALDCGAAVSLARWKELLESSVWEMTPECVHSGSPLRDCVSPKSSSTFLQFTCSDSVRLVNGTSLCSGRLEVKSDQSWSSVSEEDFDQQDAEVVCRELGCGAPSDLQGALYGEAEAPTWTKEFQCGGNESALLDCRSSDRNSSSPGGAVGLTCSDPVSLEGGPSRCAGTLEVKHGGEWRPVGDVDWTLKEADAFCGELDCGSAVSTGRTPASSHRPVWTLASGCVHSGAALRDCAIPGSSVNILEVTCSDLLVQPNISVSSTDGGFKAQQEGFRVSGGSKFTIICSTEPQYPGGSFLLTFSSSTSEHNYTQPAVNHSAHFLFPAAEPAHQGSYSCVYQVYIFSQNFSSESDLLSLTVSEGNVKPSQRDPVRLVGGSGRCAGTLEVKHGGEWRPVGDVDWTLKEAAVFCGALDCGSAASVGRREESPHRSVWTMTPECVHSGSALRDCVTPAFSNNIVEVTCSEPLVQPM